MSPKAIKKYLDKHIEGQEEAKIAAAVMMYNHMRGIKENGIFVGPSGCGKTEIFRVLADLFPETIYIYDASSITDDGTVYFTNCMKWDTRRRRSRRC